MKRLTTNGAQQVFRPKLNPENTHQNVRKKKTVYHLKPRKDIGTPAPRLLLFPGLFGPGPDLTCTEPPPGEQSAPHAASGSGGGSVFLPTRRKCFWPRGGRNPAICFLVSPVVKCTTCGPVVKSMTHDRGKVTNSPKPVPGNEGKEKKKFARKGQDSCSRLGPTKTVPAAQWEKTRLRARISSLLLVW